MAATKAVVWAVVCLTLLAGASCYGGAWEGDDFEEDDDSHGVFESEDLVDHSGGLFESESLDSSDGSVDDYDTSQVRQLATTAKARKAPKKKGVLSSFTKHKEYTNCKNACEKLRGDFGAAGVRCCLSYCKAWAAKLRSTHAKEDCKRGSTCAANYLKEKKQMVSDVEKFVGGHRQYTVGNRFTVWMDVPDKADCREMARHMTKPEYATFGK